MALTKNQIQALLAIQRALAQATDSGLFEEMCIHAHPDALNTPRTSCGPVGTAGLSQASIASGAWESESSCVLKAPHALALLDSAS